jgi:hypothetical protein
MLTRHMLAEARASADHVRPDANVRLATFNATNALLDEASVPAQLGEHLAALSAAERIHPAALTALLRERRTHHLVDTAGSAQAAGRTDPALRTLLDAEQISPQEVHALPAARTVIVALQRDFSGPTGSSQCRWPHIIWARRATPRHLLRRASAAAVRPNFAVIGLGLAS